MVPEAAGTSAVLSSKIFEVPCAPGAESHVFPASLLPSLLGIRGTPFALKTQSGDPGAGMEVHRPLGAW